MRICLRRLLTDRDSIELNGYDWDRDDVEEALSIMGYTMDDFENGLVDEYELEEVLEDL